jgi:hypothetical protein
MILANCQKEEIGSGKQEGSGWRSRTDECRVWGALFASQMTLRDGPKWHKSSVPSA